MSFEGSLGYGGAMYDTTVAGKARRITGIGGTVIEDAENLTHTHDV